MYKFDEDKIMKELKNTLTKRMKHIIIKISFKQQR